MFGVSGMRAGEGQSYVTRVKEARHNIATRVAMGKLFILKREGMVGMSKTITCAGCSTIFEENVGTKGPVAGHNIRIMNLK